MDVLWPTSLLLLALIPSLIAVYIWMLRRRRRYAVRYSSLSLLREALPRQSKLRRHLPFALFLLALACLVMAFARPVTITSLPTNQTTILLSIDVSLSMRQNDIAPNRLEAAERAALNFVQRQKPGTQIGLVAFSGFAELVQPPTTDQEDLQAAIESLTLGRRTAIGSGILRAIDAIAEVDPNVQPSTKETDPVQDIIPVPRGAYAPDIIVLLTDGVSNTGPTPLEAAKQAADRGLRVYTIGFGTERGGDMPFDRQQFQGQGSGQSGSSDPFGGTGGGGSGQGFGWFRRGIDEETLKQVAEATGGKYYSASSSKELQEVFENLPTYLIMKHEVTEVSVMFTAAGALLAALAIGLSLLWHPLP